MMLEDIISTLCRQQAALIIQTERRVSYNPHCELGQQISTRRVHRLKFHSNKRIRHKDCAKTIETVCVDVLYSFGRKLL